MAGFSYYNKYPPDKRVVFLFRHSLNLYWQRTSALIFDLPAMHPLLATRKRVARVKYA